MEEDKEKTNDHADYNGSVDMSEVNVKVDELVLAVKNSTEYIRYQKALHKIREYPEIEKEVNEFRRKNYEIQKQKHSEYILDEALHLEQEYAALRRNPMVDDYLAAELALCRVIQEINLKLVGDLEFELGFAEEE